MPSPWQIITHTPFWVWPLMALVLGLGWYSRRERVLPPARLAILPLVGLGVTAVGVLQSAAPAVTLGGWLVGLLISLPVGHAIGRQREVRRQPDGRIWIGSGWFIFAFAVSIFAVRYALGVTFGVWPELARQPIWMVFAGAVGGVIAGLGLGWLSGLLWRGRWMRRSLLAGASLPVVALAAVAAVIAFDSPAPLPRLAAGDTLPGIERWNMAALPTVSRVAARDGAPLTYRLYGGRPDRAVVLVHGSTGASISMHQLALALQAAGATVYSISLRGHGGSGTVNGDTSYRDQLDDDLADFTRAVGLDKAGIHRTLIGFSSGGGFVLREASGRNRALFDAYLAISPVIGQDSPTSRPAAGGWASVAVPRLIALSILDGFGLPWFQGLPVVRFATPAAASDSRTPVYSYRLLAGMHLARDWRQRIAGIGRPLVVAVGEKDELFKADQFQPLFAELNPRVPVAVLPGLGHMDMITSDVAVSRIAAMWRRLTDGRFDFKVREDMFAGFDGDKGSFERAMKLIADTLEREPDDAEALTWRGAGRLFLSGQAFQRGAIGEGQSLGRQGLADLERAGALQPNSIAVRAARGPALLIYARFVRPYDKALGDRLARTALEDFDFLLADKQAGWSKLAEHDRGEILGGLAEGWLQLGDASKADGYLERMLKELPGTPYAQNASVRRADPSGKTSITCLGCH